MKLLFILSPPPNGFSIGDLMKIMINYFEVIKKDLRLIYAYLSILK